MDIILKPRLRFRNRYVLLTDILLIAISALGSYVLRLELTADFFRFYLQAALWLLFTSLIIKPVDLTVSLLNEVHEPLMTWNVKHAWPKKWSHSDLNAEQNALAIETFELQYQYFTLS